MSIIVWRHPLAVDRAMLGGGVVPGSAEVLADLGLGNHYADITSVWWIATNTKVSSHVSGEESASQIKCVRNVSGCKRTDYIYAETNLEDIVAQVEALKRTMSLSTRFKLDDTSTG